MDDLQSAGRLIETLRPWLGQLVIVGGWAHRLHRLHPAVTMPSYMALATRDADLAFSPETIRHGDMCAALRAAARMPQDRTLTPDRVRQVCAHGVEAIFGTS